ncbi:MAG: DUF4836 family protein [Bacteroidetes bacterium]|nr:DUF4836 family protein [Bacteroidota bacterium]
MQTRFRLSVVLFIAAVAVFSSCSKKNNKEGRYIPGTATAVFMLNGESVSNKLSWNEMKENGILNKVDSSMEDYAKAAFENPENTGIDLKKNLVLFFENDSLGGYVVLEGSIKDAAKFKAFNSKAFKGAAETEKNDIHIINTPKVTSTWDKEKFVVLIDMPKSNRNFGNPDGARPTGKRDNVQTATGIYELSESKSMGYNEKFTELVGKAGDIHFFVNSAAIYEDNPASSMLGMTKMGDLYKDAAFTGIANFDNGKINIDMKSYVGKQLSDLYKKYSDVKVNTDMIKRIPSKDIAALFAMNVKPEGIKEFITTLGLDGLVNLSIAKLGLTLDDCVKALKGDFVMAVSDIKKDSLGSPEVNAIFSASVADKGSFNKLTELINNMKKQNTDAEKYFYYTLNNDYFTAGNKETVDKYMSGGSNNNYSFLDKASGSSFIFYVNLQTVMNAMKPANNKDSLDMASYDLAAKTWENILMTGGGFKDGGTNMHAEINFMDKNTNSLKQLNSFMGSWKKIDDEKRLARDKWMNDVMAADSIAMTIPTK